jgi:hypothetical protein
MRAIAQEANCRIPMHACPDESQLNTLNKILEQPYGIHMLSGGAGTSKSFLTRLLAIVFIMQGKGIILSAASASAAKLLSSHANTVHSTYGVNSFSRTFSSLDSCSAALASSTVHFIDEYSMLHGLHFDVVLQRIRTAQACDSINTMLQKNLIILVGDEAYYHLSSYCHKRLLCTRIS